MKERKEYNIDLAKETNFTLGKLASMVAGYLRGKDRVGFTPNEVANVSVNITNAKDLKISDKKMTENYITYSGHPGGQKIRDRAYVIEKKGMKEVIRLAVLRMLPNNKLRAKIIKNLTITD